MLQTSHISWEHWWTSKHQGGDKAHSVINAPTPTQFDIQQANISIKKKKGFGVFEDPNVQRVKLLLLFRINKGRKTHGWVDGWVGGWVDVWMISKWMMEELR